MTERQLHKYRAGWTTGYCAHDDFEAGYIKLAAGSKNKDFIHRTLMDTGNIHGNDVDSCETLDGHEEEDTRAIYDGGIPLPNVLVQGILFGGMEDDEGVGLGSDSDEEN
jgi:hypothetical protein